MVQFSRDVQLSWWQASLINYFSWWALLVVIIVVTVGGWLTIYPLYTNWQNMTKSEQLRSELAIKSVQFDNLKKKIADWQDLRDSINTDLHLILPPNVDLANLMVEIDSLVNNSGFSLYSLSFVDSAARDKNKKVMAASQTGVRTISVFVDITGGDYTKFKELIKQIQSAWRLLEVGKINFISDGSYSMELISYYYPL